MRTTSGANEMMVERYREWYEHERDCNDNMISMIESVPEDRRDDPTFATAVTLAAHLAACRENWLDRMVDGTRNQTAWWPDGATLDSLRPRFAAIESRWTDYLNSISDESLSCEFEFPTTDGNRYRWSIEGQIVQLVGHAFYHRGQIAQIVDELGGKTVDTDYLFWAYNKNPRYGKIS